MRSSIIVATLVLATLAGGGLHAAAATGDRACSNAIVGTAFGDTLNGSPAGDLMSGQGGDDAIRGHEGDDCIAGGAGYDALWGGPGSDRVSGGTGDDRLVGDAGPDQLIGGSGADTLEGGDGRDTLNGGPGRDRIDAVGYGYPDGWHASGRNTVKGAGGNDTIDTANGRPDRVECGAGADTVRADRSDRLSGCEHRERVVSPLPSASPRSGGRTRPFTISFRSLDNLRSPAEFVSIMVQGPAGSACGRAVGNSVGVSYGRNRVIRYRLTPYKGAGHRAHRWCSGRYEGAASVMRKVQPACAISATRPPKPACVKETKLGSFSFRVR
jgi:Ca2+-binding RTX toxin-like protein